MKEGAFDYRVKPFNIEELLTVIFKAIERKNLLEIHRIGKQNSRRIWTIPGLFLHDHPIPPNVRLLKEAELHAASMVPVLITGETGQARNCLPEPFTRQVPAPVNVYSCQHDALSPSLFESEFYGHTRGSIYGAVQDRCGLLETASQGTMFLDEIGSLPLELQGKLLRVLQEGDISRSAPADLGGRMSVSLPQPRRALSFAGARSLPEGPFLPLVRSLAYPASASEPKRRYSTSRDIPAR
jgi:two-component system response regulator AtoC